MNAIASIIGAVSGCISLLAIIYFLGVWRGRVDSALRILNNLITQYPPAEMWTMTKTLWDIYVVSALQGRPDLAAHGSGYKLKKEGLDLIPESLKLQLAGIDLDQNHNNIATGYLVVKTIDMEEIQSMAILANISIQESIAILSCWIEEHNGL